MENWKLLDNTYLLIINPTNICTLNVSTGYHKGYQYNHNIQGPVDQEYLPKQLAGTSFFRAPFWCGLQRGHAFLTRYLKRFLHVCLSFSSRNFLIFHVPAVSHHCCIINTVIVYIVRTNSAVNSWYISTTAWNSIRTNYITGC